MGTQPLNTPFDNTNDPMVFIIPAVYPNAFVDFELTFTADAGSFEQDIIYTAVIGMPDYLLVDDDGGLDEHEYFTTAMENLALVYDIWDVNATGSPAADLDDYPYVIWFTGDSRTETMSPENVNGLTSYLNNGGLLLITSQDIVQRLSERGDPADMLFLNSYLKVDYEMRETNHLVVGETGTLFEGLQVLTAGNGGAGNQISQDALLVQPGGVVQMLYGTDKVAAVSSVGFNYAAISFGFGIEGIHNDYPGYDTREDVLDAALAFLSSAVGIDDNSNFPITFEIKQNYPNPFNPTTNISFIVPIDAEVKISVYDILGRLIDTPLDKFVTAGEHNITWDGSNFSSGIYFYRLETSDVTTTKRMTLLK
jgi:hypothetical protein